MFDFLSIAIFGLILGWIMCYVIQVKPNNNKLNKIRKAFILDFEKIKEEYKSLEEKCNNLTNELVNLKNQYSTKSEKFAEIVTQKLLLEQLSLNIPRLELEVKKQLTLREQTLKNNIELEKKVSELTTLLASERKYSSEKEALLSNAKNKMIDEFKFMAGVAFREEGVRFANHNKIQISSILTPLKEQLGEFKRKVEDVYDKESRDRSVLLSEIYKLKTLNESIGKEAVNLTKALKGDIKAQGGWGELVLEKVLEISGLQKGRSYDLQVPLKKSNGDKYRPDAIIRLPEGRDVVVDSKVSLKNYEQYYSSDNELDRRIALKKHLISIKSHIKELTLKSYENLYGIRSLDFVLMFIPIEEAFFLAMKQEASILSEAFHNNVFIVCPSTLLITLRTINNIWRDADQNKNSLEIARQAGEMCDKFAGFVNAIDDIGKQLTKANDSYLVAKNRLISGRGNLLRRVQNLKDLGLKTKKKIPKSFEEGIL